MNTLTKYVMIPVAALAVATGSYFALRDSPAQKMRAQAQEAKLADFYKSSTIAPENATIDGKIFETTVKPKRFWRDPSIKLKVTQPDGAVFEATDYKADGTVEEFQITLPKGEEVSSKDFYNKNRACQLAKANELYTAGMAAVRAENARIEANRIANLEEFVKKYK